MVYASSKYEKQSIRYEVRKGRRIERNGENLERSLAQFILLTFPDNPKFKERRKIIK